MTNIKFGFSQKDSHDFKIVTMRETICNEHTHDKKIIKKYKIPQFRNEEIKCIQRVRRIDDKNAPKCMKNAEYFVAPNPFGKYGFSEKFEPYGWTLLTALLAFKCEYIDGFFKQQNRTYFYGSNDDVAGIIIVDPIQRLEVRKWTENAYKDFLEICNAEDFEYSVYDGRGTRIGIDKRYDSIDDVKCKIIKDVKHFDKNNFFTAKHEIDAVKKYGFDKVFDTLCHMLFYIGDIRDHNGIRSENSLTFKTMQDAKDFENKFTEWQKIYNDTYSSLYIIPTNEKLENLFFVLNHSKFI